MDFHDTTFFLTGGASGIGRELAAELVRRGARLMVTDLRENDLLAIAESAGWRAPQVEARGQDVRDSRRWAELIDEACRLFGRLDVLLNVAGVLKPGYAHESGAEDVHLHMDVNAKGMIFGVQAAARAMIPLRRGHIVNIASLAGVAPVPGLSLYSASKFAIRGFSLAAAQELRRHGICVSVLCPDAVRTPMLDLQRDYPQAALTFSGDRTLDTGEIVRAILDDILINQPVEVMLPRSRGVLAAAANLSPGAAALLEPVLRKRGLSRQKQLR
ncbi:MAG: 3-phenylpropionate-dihydrodiol/cinnamic acid-dihydrodiol dehydrogenase [Myxococcota bacterium]|nr:3-phenylpropionate-dihydrodiol/cinnamic acid-dihydrodiol dehydrogenase [Myxococcota bacterium]